jgi:hypothetical protein
MNSNQLIDNDEALRLFFNDDLYLIGGTTGIVASAIKDKHTHEVATEEHQLVANKSETAAALHSVEEGATNYQEATMEFKYLGKNEKSILILVNDSQNPVSTPQGTELLRKLVLSINLKNADFALVNYSAYPTAKFAHFRKFFSCKTVFAFGVSSEHLNLPAQTLHELAVVEDTKIIFTHNLHALDSDLPAKKALWATLKNL